MLHAHTNPGGTMTDTLRNLSPLEITLIGCLGFSLVLYFVSFIHVERLRARLWDTHQHLLQTEEQERLLDRQVDIESTARMIAETQNRSLRESLAIDRARVDHLVGIGRPNVRHAARSAQPFPDFGLEPAGVRSIDDARRQAAANSHTLRDDAVTSSLIP